MQIKEFFKALLQNDVKVTRSLLFFWFLLSFGFLFINPLSISFSFIYFLGVSFAFLFWGISYWIELELFGILLGVPLGLLLNYIFWTRFLDTLIYLKREKKIVALYSSLLLLTGFALWYFVSSVWFYPYSAEPFFLMDPSYWEPEWSYIFNVDRSKSGPDSLSLTNLGVSFIVLDFAIIALFCGTLARALVIKLPTETTTTTKKTWRQKAEQK